MIFQHFSDVALPQKKCPRPVAPPPPAPPAPGPLGPAAPVVDAHVAPAPESEALR